MKDRWDNTKITCFAQDCEFKYFLQYENHIVPNKLEAALLFGQGIHAIGDALFRNEPLEKAIADFRTVYPISLDDKRTVELGEQIARDYYKRYETQPFDEIVEIEKWKEIEFGGIIYGAKFDKVVKWHYGIMSLDHKTTSEYLAEYAKTVDMVHQFTGHVCIAKEHWGAGNEMLVDLIHIPRMLKTKAASTDFDRIMTPRTEKEIKEWKSFVLCCVDDINKARDNMFWRKFDNSCRSWNRICGYKSLCELSKSAGLRAVVEYAKSSIDYKIKEWKPWEM